MNVTGLTRDLAGRVTAISRANDTTRIRYDHNGRVVGVTPSGRSERTFERTLKGEVHFYREGATEVEALYTPAGQLRELHFPGGEVARIETIPALNRMNFETSAPGVGTERSSYIRTAFMHDGENGQFSATYNFGGEMVAQHALRVLPRSTPAAFRSSHVVGYTYSGPGYPSGLSLDGSPHESQRRDFGGRLTGVGLSSISGGELAAYLNIGRSASLDVVETSLGPIATHVEMNGFREQELATVQFDPTTRSGDEQPICTLQTLERDGGGRILQEQEDIYGEVTLRGYEYDPHGRLRDVYVNGEHTAHYTYDSNGNRLSRSGGGGEEVGVYDDRDRAQSYGRYDYTTNANGYVEDIRDRVEGTSLHLNYNVRGWLRGATLPDGRVVRYDVDPFGRRIGKSIDGQPVASWMYADEFRPIAEFDATGNLKWRFAYGEVGHVPSMMLKGTTPYRVISDARGSVRLVVDAGTGLAVQRLDYDEFGRVIRDTNPGFQPFGFAGGLYDPDTGLTRFGARDYDPYTGRWTARDPILFGGGALNLYEYVGNDPVNFIDPSGYFLITAAIGGVVGAAGGALIALATNQDVVAGAITGGVTGLAVASGTALFGMAAEGLGLAAGTGGHALASAYGASITAFAGNAAGQVVNILTSDAGSGCGGGKRPAFDIRQAVVAGVIAPIGGIAGSYVSAYASSVGGAATTLAGEAAVGWLSAVPEMVAGIFVGPE